MIDSINGRRVAIVLVFLAVLSTPFALGYFGAMIQTEPGENMVAPNSVEDAVSITETDERINLELSDHQYADAVTVVVDGETHEWDSTSSIALFADSTSEIELRISEYDEESGETQISRTELHEVGEQNLNVSVDSHSDELLEVNEHTFEASASPGNLSNAENISWYINEEQVYGGNATFSHEFESGGVYTVSLSAKLDGIVYKSSTDVSITDVEDMIIEAEASPLYAEPSDSIEFSAVEEYDRPADTYEWEFSDGSTANGESVTRAFAEEGEYSVTLTAISEVRNATDTDEVIVSITSPDEPEEYLLPVGVSDQNGDTLEGASVEIGNVSIETNERGVALFELEEGDYTVSADMVGYDDVEDSISITESGNNLNLELVSETEDGDDVDEETDDEDADEDDDANGDLDGSGDDTQSDDENDDEGDNEEDDTDEETVSCDGVGYGVDDDGAYLVGTLEQLQCLPEQGLDEDYRLSTDLDASPTSQWDSGAGFDPLGNPSEEFTGSFDGDGYEISNLHIYRPDESFVGVFGTVDSEGIVQNVTIQDVSVVGDQWVGGLVGQSYGELDEIHVTGSVTGMSDWTGGLVGQSHEDVTMSTASVEVDGNTAVGGLIGGLNDNSATVHHAYAMGEVEGEQYVGGLVGSVFRGSISESYSTARTIGDEKVGGLTGHHEGNMVNESYVGGYVSNGEDSGSLVGTNEADIQDSYFDESVTAREDIGYNNGTVTNIEGLYTEEMQSDSASSNMVGLDFHITWVTVENDYPRLLAHFEEEEEDEEGEEE